MKRKKKESKKNKNKKTTKKPGSLGDRMWGEKILRQFHFMLFLSTFLLVHWGLGSSRPRTMTSTTVKGGEYHPWDYLLPSGMNTLFCFQVSLNIEWKISQSLCCFFLFLPLKSLLYRLAREGEKRVRWHEAHVKSCRMTRAGLKGTSMFLCCMTFQFRIFSTSFFFTKNWSQFRMAASRRTLIENGKDPSNKRRKHNKQKTMRHLIIRAL